MPSFPALPATDGKAYGPSDFERARVLIVVFSCNHCPYVQGYEDRMIAFARDFAARGVAFVAINANDGQQYPEDNFDEMVVRAKARGYPFVYLRDEDQTVATAFGASHTPEFFLFGGRDHEGSRHLAYHGRFDDNFNDPQAVRRRYLHEATEATLAGKPVPEPETHSIGCTIKWVLS